MQKLGQAVEQILSHVVSIFWSINCLHTEQQKFVFNTRICFSVMTTDELRLPKAATERYLKLLSLCRCYLKLARSFNLIWGNDILVITRNGTILWDANRLLIKLKNYSFVNLHVRCFEVSCDLERCTPSTIATEYKHFLFRLFYKKTWMVSSCTWLRVQHVM